MSTLLVLALLAQGDFERVELEAVRRSTEDGVSLMEQWRVAHRGSPDEARALLWEAQQRLAQGNQAQARALLLLARQTPSSAELQWDVALSLADLLALEHRYGEAAQAYQSLGAPPGSRWAEQAQLRASAMRGAMTRRWVSFGLAAVSALVVLVGAWRSRRSLWPPPEEFTWAGPVLGLLALAGLSRPADERSAVLTVSLGGLGLLWVTGARLRSRRLTVRTRVLEAALATFLSASLLFIAISVAELWPRVLDTLMGGAE